MPNLDYSPKLMEYVRNASWDLSHIGFPEQNLTSADITKFFECAKENPFITNVDLSENNIDDNTIIDVAPLVTKIKTLKLFGNCISNNGMAALAKVNSVTSLDISANTLTDEGLSHFKGNLSLKSLFIGGNAITDRSLVTLLSMPNLTSLNLLCTAASDTTVISLAKSNQLYSLNITGTKLSDLSAKALLQSLNLIELHAIGSGFSLDAHEQLKETVTKRYQALLEEKKWQAIGVLASYVKCDKGKDFSKFISYYFLLMVFSYLDESNISILLTQCLINNFVPSLLEFSFFRKRSSSILRIYRFSST